MPIHGVSITIPEPYAATLQRARELAGDPLAPLIPPHVTLLPPTEVAGEVLADFKLHLERVSRNHAAFEMRLVGTGTFRPISPVVFAQVSAGIGSCERLEQDIRSGPVERELQFTYRPHVTIAHNVDDRSLDVAYAEYADFRASFTVESVELCCQDGDGTWHPVASYALSG